jgi:hypothetical protein
MCHFLSGVLPRGVERKKLAHLLAAGGFAFAPLDNAHVRAQLRADEEYCRVTSSWCDCGTPLGSEGRKGGPIDPGAHEERQRAELRAKGWGEAKVERWIEQRRKTSARDERVRRGRNAAVRAELETWRDALTDLARAAGQVGLLLHWYRGALETERIVIARRHHIPVAALAIDRLAGIEEDVLYEIR